MHSFKIEQSYSVRFLLLFSHPFVTNPSLSLLSISLQMKAFYKKKQGFSQYIFIFFCFSVPEADGRLWDSWKPFALLGFSTWRRFARLLPWGCWPGAGRVGGYCQPLLRLCVQSLFLRSCALLFPDPAPLSRVYTLWNQSNYTLRVKCGHFAD